MSKQGNIVTREYGVDLMYTTSRWGGGETPEMVQKVLKNHRKNWPKSIEEAPSDIEHELVTLDGYYLNPIRALGNTDTPTVLVDLDKKVVYFRREYNQTILGSWSFKAFADLDFMTLSYFSENYLE